MGIPHVEFWIQLSNRIIDVELMIGDNPQQKAVLVEIRKDLERFKNWTMAESDVERLLEELGGVPVPCQHSEGYYMRGSDTHCPMCGVKLDL